MSGARRWNLPAGLNFLSRHSRESGNPFALMLKAKVDSSLLKAEHIHVLSRRARFRGNDGQKARGTER